MLSDDSTSDSDTGIRFKTDSTRRPTTGKDDPVKGGRGVGNGNERRRDDRHSKDHAHSKRRNESPHRDRSRKTDLDYQRSGGGNNGSYSKRRSEREGSEKSRKKHRNHGEIDLDRNEKTHSRNSSRLDGRSGDGKADAGKYEFERHAHPRNSNEVISNIKNTITRHLTTTSVKTGKDRPQMETGKDRPLRESSKDSPQMEIVKDRPQRETSKDRPQRETSRDRPRRETSRDRPQRETSRDRPHRETSKDQPQRETSRDRPQKETGKDRPQTETSKDRPLTENSKDEEFCNNKDNNSKKHHSHKKKDEPKDLDPPKPTSYYNMTVDHSENGQVVISGSDSSEDEEELRRQVITLKEKLKGTKEKKKCRHRDRKKSHHKRSKSKHKEYDETTSTENNIPEQNPSEKTKPKPDEVKEEGEIFSDSDTDDDESKEKRLRDKLLMSRSIKAKLQSETVAKSQEEPPIDVEGPALPPDMMRSSNKNKNIGPAIPDEHRKQLENSTKTYIVLDDDDDDFNSENGDVEVIGPLPASGNDNLSNAHRRLEERALQLKIGSIDGHSGQDSKAENREEWMLKLPDVKGLQLGLTSRQFRAREGPDLSDRSSWTDTPEQKALKEAGVQIETEVSSEKLRKHAESSYIQSRNEEQEAIIKKHKKKNKRDMSLLELHQKKLKKKKKKDDQDKSERRRFDRNIDLQANRFDEAQKKAVLKKAQLLDTRFNSGKSKYL